MIEAMNRYMRAVMLRLPTEAPGVGAVTKEQWWTLVEVGKADPDGISMSELAARRGMAINSATALVERLCLAGLLERRHDASDRRVVRVTLTPEGRRVRGAISALRRAEYERLLASLSADELQTLHAAVPALARLAEVAGSQ